MTCAGYSMNTNRKRNFALYKDFDWNLWYKNCTITNYHDLKQQYLWSDTNKDANFKTNIKMVFKKIDNKLTLTFWKGDVLIGTSIEDACISQSRIFDKGVFYLNEQFTYFPMFSSIGCTCCKNGITITVECYEHV